MNTSFDLRHVFFCTPPFDFFRRLLVKIGLLIYVNCKSYDDKRTNYAITNYINPSTLLPTLSTNSLIFANKNLILYSLNKLTFSIYWILNIYFK